MLAAALTTAAYIPQAYKTIKTRSTKDLSLVTFSMLFVGTILWFVYGLYIHDTPLMLANGITATLSLAENDDGDKTLIWKSEKPF
jgi:MtN3 and saliva related transmembrane protein